MSTASPTCASDPPVQTQGVILRYSNDMSSITSLFWKRTASGEYTAGCVDASGNHLVNVYRSGGTSSSYGIYITPVSEPLSLTEWNVVVTSAGDVGTHTTPFSTEATELLRLGNSPMTMMSITHFSNLRVTRMCKLYGVLVTLNHRTTTLLLCSYPTITTR